MGRLALRPALRAYAHAPAGVEEEFSPGDISGTILWVDPSDSSTITTTSGTPGTDGEDTTSITDKIAGKVFSHPSGYWLVYGAYTDATAGSLGNGLAFLKSPSNERAKHLWHLANQGGYSLALGRRCKRRVPTVDL